jgi:uncharacterized membrane protein HdeD (DUF308 family)
VLQLASAIALRRHEGNAGRVLGGIAALTGGILMLRFPPAGLVAISVTLAFYFFLSGAAKWSFSAELRPRQGWGWLFASAMTSFILGVYQAAEKLAFGSFFRPPASHCVDFSAIARRNQFSKN